MKEREREKGRRKRRVRKVMHLRVFWGGSNLADESEQNGLSLSLFPQTHTHTHTHSHIIKIPDKPLH